MGRPAYRTRRPRKYAVPITREAVERLRQLSERFAALGRPLPQWRIIEDALTAMYREWCLTTPTLPISREHLESRYSAFLFEGGKPAEDAGKQAAAHLERMRALHTRPPEDQE